MANEMKNIFVSHFSSNSKTREMMRKNTYLYSSSSHSQKAFMSNFSFSL